MRIIPDETKITYLIDSHPDKPEDADYLEVSECDTIEITDAEWNEIFRLYYLYLESLLGHDGQLRNRNESGIPFSQYLAELISLAGEGK